MLVSDLMTTQPITISSNASLQDAAQVMRTHNIGMLPVLEHGHLRGVVTDRDLAVRAVAAGDDARTTTVDNIMTNQCVTCFDRDDIETAVDLMEAKSVRRIIVTDRKNPSHLVGLLSVDDIARRSHDADLSGRTSIRLHQKRELVPTGCLPTSTEEVNQQGKAKRAGNVRNPA